MAHSTNTNSNDTNILSVFDPTNYSPVRATVITLSTCGYLAAVLTAFWIVAGRNRFEVRLTQPGTTFACFFSLSLLNGGIILGVKSDKTADWCVARLWTVQLSMAMVLACSFMKAGRLYAMDRSQSTSPLRMSEERFFLFLSIYLFLHSFCLGYWTFFEPLTVSTNWGDPVCMSQGWIGQVSALCSLVFIWFIWFYWAVATNHLGPRLTETAWVCALVVGLAGLTGIASGYLSMGSVIVSGPVLFDQEARLLAESIAGFVVTCTYAFFVIHPKLNNNDGFDDMVSDIERRRAEKRRGSALTSKSSRSSLTLTSSSQGGGLSRNSSLTSMGGADGLAMGPPSHRGSAASGMIIPRIDETEAWEETV